jgi:uncharacterized protein YkwD
MKPTTFFLSTLIAALFALSGCNSNGVNSDYAVSHDTHTEQTPQKNDTTQSETDQPTTVDATSAEPNTSVAQNDTADKKTVVARVSEEDRAAFLDAINAARAETQDCGDMGVFDPAPALSWNDRLANAAYEHSYDMAQSDTFSHTGSGTQSDATAQLLHPGTGSSFQERIEHQGYTQWRRVGENIAAGYADPEEVVEGWLESPHHCANLMNPVFTEVGMALVTQEGSDYYFYWSQELGTK